MLTLNKIKKLVSYIFISDISLFTGAQSGLGQSGWFWNNGTRIIDQAYPASNLNLCQQMSWPLTYRDGINLRGKSCEDSAYFMCQIKCEFFINFSL